MNIKLKSLFFKKDKIIIDTIIVFAGTVLGGFLNLLYHLVTVRMLTPQDYGVFNALIAFVSSTTMAISPLGATLTRFFSEYIAKNQISILGNAVRKIFKRLLLIALIVFLVFFICSNVLSQFLKVNPLYIIICGAVIAFSVFTPPVNSLFQSFQKFALFSAVGIGSSFVKLLVGGVLMYLGFSVFGALVGLLIPAVCILILYRIFYPKFLNNVNIKKEPVNLFPIYKYFLPVSVAMFSFTFITNIDVILVKHFFSELDAGFYSIAQMVGKIFLFLPSALAIVIFPKSTQNYVNNNHSNKILYKSLIVASVICIFAVLICALFPHFVLSILTGKSNPASLQLVLRFAVAMSMYALLWIVINFALAVHDVRFVIPLAFLTILEALAIYFFHSSLLSVVTLMLIFSIASFLIIFLIVRSNNGFKKQKIDI